MNSRRMNPECPVLSSRTSSQSPRLPSNETFDPTDNFATDVEEKFGSLRSEVANLSCLLANGLAALTCGAFSAPAGLVFVAVSDWRFFSANLLCGFDELTTGLSGAALV